MTPDAQHRHTVHYAGRLPADGSYRSARLRNASRPALIASHAQITPKT